MILMTDRTRIREETKAGTSRVDREAGIIRDCALLGRNSANGRTYSDAALEHAAQLYEGCPVRLDHKPSEKRSLLDDIGVLRNVRKVGGKVRGDFVVNMCHPSAAYVMEKAERFPATFGFSHEADGLVEEGVDGKQHVTDLIFVESVDLVSTPATNKSLFESAVRNLDPFDIRQMFEDHGYRPSATEFEACSQILPRLRDGYIDTLRAAAALKLYDRETEKMRESFLGITGTRPSLMDQLCPGPTAHDQARSQRFVEELQGSIPQENHGEFEEALASFHQELARSM